MVTTVSYRVAALVLALAALTGCTSAQRQAIARATAPPPVDLRAVKDGVEVRFVCRPGVPMMSTVNVIDKTNTGPDATPTTYPDPRHANAVRSIILPIPAADRHVHLRGFVGLFDSQPGVFLGIYTFDFRYDKLPDEHVASPSQATTAATTQAPRQTEPLPTNGKWGPTSSLGFVPSRAHLELLGLRF
jgi:hypothetical protein